MKFSFKFLIALIATLTILTRFIALDFVPPHLSNDEISIAYDAYSVSKTLKDEHNHFLPLSFQSHSTYKAPLTAYLTIPSIILFGNTDFAARFPSAFLGSLTVLIIGLLVFELSNNKSLGLLSSLILAIAPFHILTSRMAYEANIALFFFTLGIYLFLKSSKKPNNSFVILSFVSFALSLYGYHTEWVFTPFVIFILFLLNYKAILKRKIYILGVFVFLLLIAPLVIDSINNLHSSTRASTVNLLREPSLARRIEDPIVPLWQKVSFVIQVFIDKYSSYFNLSYIFFTGYNLLPEEDPYQIGVFLFPFLPFLFIGIYKAKSLLLSNSKFIYILLLTSPLTASFTSGPQSTSRNLISLIPFSILCSIGLFVFWHLSKRIWRLILVTTILISFLYFLLIFYYHFPKDHGEGYQYGYKQIALFIKPRYQDFKDIIIDPRFGPAHMYSGIPHLYIPYFTYLDPNKLQQSKKEKTGSAFDKYHMREINWGNERLKKNVLYVVPISNAPDEGLKLKKIYTVILPNGKEAFYLYTSD